MKKIFLLVAIWFFCLMFGVSANVSAETSAEVAAREAGRRFGAGAMAELVTSFYGVSGDHLIDLYAVKTSDGGDGTMLISVQTDPPALVAFHYGQSVVVSVMPEAEAAVADYAGAPAEFLGVLYVTPLEYYLEFEAEGTKILYDPFRKQVIPRDGLVIEESPILQPSLAGNLAHGAGAYPPSLYIPGVPDYQQIMKNSCAPTATATVLGFWDKQGYENILPEDSAEDVAELIQELATAMAWDPAIGTYVHMIPYGIATALSNRGYFDIQVRQAYAVSMDAVRWEISAGRPFIYATGSAPNGPWGSPHAVTVVGYENDFIVVHDNWWTTPADYYVLWSSIGHVNDSLTVVAAETEQEPTDDLPPSLPATGGGGGCFIGAIF